MNKIKFLLLGLLITVSFLTYSQDDSTSIDTINVIVEGAGNGVELIKTIGENAQPILDAINDDSFPPKTPAAWIVFFVSIGLPFFSTLLSDKVKYTSLLNKIKSKGNTNAIIVWVSIALSGIYEGVVSGIDFDFTDWGGYSILVYGASMAIHEFFKSKKDTKEPS